jgi:hypothetical protein
MAWSPFEGTLMPNISFTQAVMTAKETIKSLYIDDPLKGLALEEIESVEVDNRKYWAVTLGFHRIKSITQNTSTSLMDSFRPPPPPVEHRVYKTVLIDAETGEFFRLDMRIVP